jgi:hypothetical protein
MTQEQYEDLKKIKEIEGKILMKIAENYSIKIQVTINDLMKERDIAASCHAEAYLRAYSEITKYEEEQLTSQVKSEIEELTRCV